MTLDTLPNYSVRELNEAIARLLERGFAPRFVVKAFISKSQLKKGHLWLTLSDGTSSISAVIWASQLQKIDFMPNEGDGVVIVGKLNFWAVRASLAVQVLDIRPSLSTVLRKFEVVKALFLKEGLLEAGRRRVLPKYPRSIAILTSVPSSAHADMIRTAKERWPLTRLFVIPIPVQGSVSREIQSALHKVAICAEELEIEAIVLARGGGSREDLMVFDDEELGRTLASFPLPVVTGLGHEDDLTVADLVADHRAATPTAAMVDLLPSFVIAQEYCLQRRKRLNDQFVWLIRRERQRLLDRKKLWKTKEPLLLIQRKKEDLQNKSQLLNALSPDRVLMRGFAIVRNRLGRPVNSIQELSKGERLMIELSDGHVASIVDKIYL
ncbi:exodeoxyribonuclease VII large subunit [Prochlorococcus sp. MIT 1307]|uniref:exodeoxyribonuclease VII large subunit n=1 Tax=Prochlorococcus sp. MIT 1307 TaxID=3096219 RepID=UPI002A754FF0|nr:exodeoxyribonuclease VII large subunit [Prochlorococcus sp. MIT 1307]